MQVVDRVFYEVEWVPQRTYPGRSCEDRRKGSKESHRKGIALVKLIDLSCEVEAVQEGIVAVRLVAVAEEDIAVIRPWPHSMDGGR